MGIKPSKPQPHPQNGPRSLVDSAIETILENLADLTFEGVDCLPKILALRIWNLARERYVIPFCVWVIFSKVLRDEEKVPLSLLRFRYVITTPQLSLQTYTAALTSPAFDFLANVSITTAFPVNQLVKLASIKNLAILEIVRSTQAIYQSGVGDRLVRAWNQAASDEGAFSVLRILKLWNHKEITETSIHYLNSFPALALFDVKGCSVHGGSRALARTLGWKSTLDVGVLCFFEAMCVERAVNKRAVLEEYPQPIRRAPSHQIHDDSIVSRIPRVHVTAFITSPAFSVSKETTDAVPLFDEWQRWGDLSEIRDPKADFKPMRWAITNQHHFNTSYTTESWDFLPYTINSKISELRSDRDLRKAGVDIGKQVIVKDELVNSVPLVSLRLGPLLECLRPSVSTNPVKSFYGSSYTESLDPHLNELAKEYPKHNGKKKQRAPVEFKYALTREPGSIAFFRVKAPYQQPDAASSPESAKDERMKTEKRPGSASPQQSAENEAAKIEKENMEERGLPGASKESKRSFFAEPWRRPTKFMQNKKQKLNDVLGSFM